MSHHLHEALQRRRWELVEAIAVGQHEPADPRRAGVEQVLADRAAGVVADEGDVGEVEVLEEGDHLAGHAAWRLIGGGGDRVRVRAERKVGSVRTDACGGEAGGNLAPQLAVDEDPVDEHHRRGGGRIERPGRDSGRRRVAAWQWAYAPP